jgi:hypothetical protein
MTLRWSLVSGCSLSLSLSLSLSVFVLRTNRNNHGSMLMFQYTIMDMLYTLSAFKRLWYDFSPPLTFFICSFYDFCKFSLTKPRCCTSLNRMVHAVSLVIYTISSKKFFICRFFFFFLSSLIQFTKLDYLNSRKMTLIDLRGLY